MDVLSALPWPTFGWGALIVGVIWLIIHGDLVTRKIHDEIVTYWKDAYKHQLERGDRLETSFDTLLDGMETVVRVVESLPPSKGGRS